MKLRTGVVVAGLLGCSAVAQQQPLPPEAQKHFDAARIAAGTEHQAAMDAACGPALAPPTQAEAQANRARNSGPEPPPPPRERWYSEPQRVFDNLYFVGTASQSAWALATTQGIILLDAIFEYSVEPAVDQGLRKLGLSPADIKYVIVSHGHNDHVGGARFLQEKYGARLLMGAADYDLLDVRNPTSVWKPRRDLVVTDGQRLTLGDTTMTLYLTPGHTDGTVSTIFTVRDGGRPHTVATWGGTSTTFDFVLDRERLLGYVRSAARFRDIAAKAGADVILSNHTAYDGTPAKLRALQARRPGEPHPYVVGRDVVQRYLTTVGECAQTAAIVAERGAR